MSGNQAARPLNLGTQTHTIAQTLGDVTTVQLQIFTFSLQCCSILKRNCLTNPAVLIRVSSSIRLCSASAARKLPALPSKTEENKSSVISPNYPIKILYGRAGPVFTVGLTISEQSKAKHSIADCTFLFMVRDGCGKLLIGNFSDQLVDSFFYLTRNFIFFII